MHGLLLPLGDLDEAGQQVGHVGPALLRPDQRGQLGELEQRRLQAPRAAVLLDLLVQLDLKRNSILEKSRKEMSLQNVSKSGISPAICRRGCR